MRLQNEHQWTAKQVRGETLKYLQEHLSKVSKLRIHDDDPADEDSKDDEQNSLTFQEVVQGETI